MLLSVQTFVNNGINMYICRFLHYSVFATHDVGKGELLFKVVVFSVLNGTAKSKLAGQWSSTSGYGIFDGLNNCRVKCCSNVVGGIHNS